MFLFWCPNLYIILQNRVTAAIILRYLSPLSPHSSQRSFSIPGINLLFILFSFICLCLRLPAALLQQSQQYFLSFLPTTFSPHTGQILSTQFSMPSSSCRKITLFAARSLPNKDIFQQIFLFPKREMPRLSELNGYTRLESGSSYFLSAPLQKIHFITKGGFYGQIGKQS